MKAGVVKGRDLWLEAGQDLLRSGGIEAVKLKALTGALGLTIGSFYHHFDGMDGYLDALADHYGTAMPPSAIGQAEHDDPIERIRRLTAIAAAERVPPLDAAMRAWAISSPRAAAAVREADRVLLEFLARAFVDLGLAKRDAQLRAHLLLGISVARVEPPWKGRADDLDRILAALVPAAVGSSSV